MKRRVFISLLLLSLLLASCRQTAQPPAQSELAATPSEVGKITFTDALGQEYREVLAAYAAGENGIIDLVG